MALEITDKQGHSIKIDSVEQVHKILNKLGIFCLEEYDVEMTYTLKYTLNGKDYNIKGFVEDEN